MHFPRSRKRSQAASLWHLQSPSQHGHPTPYTSHRITRRLKCSSKAQIYIAFARPKSCVQRRPRHHEFGAVATSLQQPVVGHDEFSRREEAPGVLPRAGAHPTAPYGQPALATTRRASAAHPTRSPVRFSRHNTTRRRPWQERGTLGADATSKIKKNDFGAIDCRFRNG